jgi:hypothetical protein
VPERVSTTVKTPDEEDTGSRRGQHAADYRYHDLTGDPAPDANQSGTQPNTNANEVIKMERRRSLAPGAIDQRPALL